MDAAAQDYIDAIAPEHRPLFDRIHGLVLGLYPDAEVVLSYKMPTYLVGRNSLHVAVWKHGLSLYGWKDHEARFTSHHPELVGDKGTIKLRPEDLARISDDELRACCRLLSTSDPEPGAAHQDGANRAGTPQRDPAAGRGSMNGRDGQ